MTEVIGSRGGTETIWVRKDILRIVVEKKQSQLFFCQENNRFGDFYLIMQ